MTSKPCESRVLERNGYLFVEHGPMVVYAMRRIFFFFFLFKGETRFRDERKTVCNAGVRRTCVSTSGGFVDRLWRFYVKEHISPTP